MYFYGCALAVECVVGVTCEDAVGEGVGVFERGGFGWRACGGW